MIWGKSRKSNAFRNIDEFSGQFDSSPKNYQPIQMDRPTPNTFPESSIDILASNYKILKASRVCKRDQQP